MEVMCMDLCRIDLAYVQKAPVPVDRCFKPGCDRPTVLVEDGMEKLAHAEVGQMRVLELDGPRRGEVQTIDVEGSRHPMVHAARRVLAQFPYSTLEDHEKFIANIGKRKSSTAGTKDGNAGAGD